MWDGRGIEEMSGDLKGEEGNLDVSSQPHYTPFSMWYIYTHCTSTVRWKSFGCREGQAGEVEGETNADLEGGGWKEDLPGSGSSQDHPIYTFRRAYAQILDTPRGNKVNYRASVTLQKEN